MERRLARSESRKDRIEEGCHATDSGHLGEGAEPEQMDRMAQRLTQVFSEEAQVEAKHISLALVEVEADGFAEAGELVTDRRKHEAKG
ncbi:MAG: 4-oxalocrotonate tautomerase family protein [Candidatus Methylomirabilales bacterium]